VVARNTRLFPYRPEIISSLLMPMGGLDREVMLVLYLDEDGKLIANEVHRNGNSTSFSMGYRVLFERAFDHRARGLILAHNHPSGSALPSARDLHSTSALEALAAPMEIRLVDHLIVGGRSIFSMRTAGLLR
jgi:DNA repair protein RadC